MLNKRGHRNSLCNFFPKNHRGQGLSTNTIILLILGIVILIVLILGFTIGWEKIAPFLSRNNVNTIVNSCEAACATAGVYDFCSAPRDLKSDTEKLTSVTCFYLSEKKTIYGISKCESITCTSVLVDLEEGETLDSKCAGNEGKIIQGLVNNKLETREC